MIREMEERDLKAVTGLHADALRIGFLSTLGEDFLSIIYEGIMTSELGVVYVYEEDGVVAGYISGSTDTQELFRDIKKRNFFRFTGNLALKIIRRPGIIRNLRRSTRYPDMAGKSIPAELLSIAVADDFRGKGVGSALVRILVEYFGEKGLDTFKVSVDQRLQGADVFYEKLGFILTDTIDIYDKKMNIYIYNINKASEGKEETPGS